MGLFAVLLGRFWFVCDDAYISFGYADNLANGNGLVWHPDNEAVEGFSNPLWTLILSLSCWLSLDPTIVAPSVSATCGVTLLLWVGRLSLRLAGPIAAVGGMLFLAATPPMTLWSTGGLETMPAALATFAIFAGLLADRDQPSSWTAGLGATALVLLRPEGLPLAVILLLLGSAIWQRRGRPQPLGRSLRIVALVTVAVAASWLLFRLSYFGDWLPNTARAKGGFHGFRLTRGLDYLVTFALMFPGTLIALLVMPLAWRRSDTRHLCIAFAAIALSVGCYVVLVGGDFMPMGRFLVTVLPFTAMVFGVGAQELYDRDRILPLLALMVAVVATNLPPAFGSYATPASAREPFHFRGWVPKHMHGLAVWQQLRQGAQSDELLASELQEHIQPGESLIREAIGVLGYRTDLRIIDTFGLVTRRPQQDHSILPDGSPGHDRYLPWPVLLEEQPTYIHAHFAHPDDPLTYGMMNEAFATSPLCDLVDVLRFPVAEPALDGSQQELRLLRFHRWDPATDQMQRLLQACAGIDPADPDALAQLEAALPDGPDRQRQDQKLRKLAGDQRIAHHGRGAIRYSHTAKATARTHGLAVEVTMQTGQAPPMQLPRGKFVYALAIRGQPTLGGRTSGWIAVPPRARHVDVVEGGTMLLVHLIPGGAVEFGG